MGGESVPNLTVPSGVGLWYAPLRPVRVGETVKAFRSMEEEVSWRPPAVREVGSRRAARPSAAAKGWDGTPSRHPASSGVRFFVARSSRPVAPVDE